MAAPSLPRPAPASVGFGGPEISRRSVSSEVPDESWEIRQVRDGICVLAAKCTRQYAERRSR